MRQAMLTVSIGLILAPAAWSGGNKPKAPSLELRITPRFPFSPANVLIVAELKGGDDLEDFYCPEIEWDFGDGGKSVREGDCPPYEPGAKIERRYSAEHLFKRAGNYRVEVTLTRAGRFVKKQTLAVTVRPGVGDALVPDDGI